MIHLGLLYQVKFCDWVNISMPLDPRIALFRSLGLFPLQPDDPASVPCESVRGDMDVLRELGDTIVFSGKEEGYTCQLCAGRR